MSETGPVKTFAPMRSVVQNNAAGLKVTLFLAGLMIIGWLAAPAPDSDVVGVPPIVFAVPAVLFILLSLYQAVRAFVPRLVEIKPGRLCVYYASKFCFVDQSDLVEARRANCFERLFLSKPVQSVVIRDSKGNRVVVEPHLYSNPTDLNAALVEFLRPFLKTQSAVTPPTAWKLPSFFWSWMASWSSVYLSLVFIFFMTAITTGQVILAALIGPVIVFALIMLFKTRLVKFHNDRMVLRTQFKSKSIPYSNVQVLNIPAWSDEEKLVVIDKNRKIAVEFDATSRIYPQIRDFLILKCPQAHVTGRLDPQMNALCGFDAPLNLLHAPTNASPQTQTRTQVWASRHKPGEEP